MHFAAYCAGALKDEQRYADPDLSLRLSSGEICHSDLERVQSVFRRCFDDPEKVSEWFGRFVTEAKYPESNQEQYEVSEQELLDLIEQGHVLRRSEGVRFAYSQSAGPLQLYVHGEHFDCSLPLAGLLQLICDHNSYQANQLQPWADSAESRKLLCELVARGWLYFD